MGPMTTTESAVRDLFLLLTGESGRQRATQVRRQSLVAGALVDLELAGRIGLDDAHNPRLRVLDPTPTGDAVLDHVLRGLDAPDGRRLSAIVGLRAVDPTEAVGRDLADAGAVTRVPGLLGTRWPARDRGFALALRRHLGAVIAGREQPSDRDAAELAILRAQGAAYRTLHDDAPGVSRWAMHRRIDALAGDVPAARAVRRAYQSKTAAASS